jgi:hypothetical protein
MAKNSTRNAGDEGDQGGAQVIVDTIVEPTQTISPLVAQSFGKYSYLPGAYLTLHEGVGYPGYKDVRFNFAGEYEAVDAVEAGALDACAPFGIRKI